MCSRATRKQGRERRGGVAAVHDSGAWGSLHALSPLCWRLTMVAVVLLARYVVQVLAAYDAAVAMEVVQSGSGRSPSRNATVGTDAGVPLYKFVTAFSKQCGGVGVVAVARRLGRDVGWPAVQRRPLRCIDALRAVPGFTVSTSPSGGDERAPAQLHRALLDRRRVVAALARLASAVPPTTAVDSGPQPAAAPDSPTGGAIDRATAAVDVATASGAATSGAAADVSAFVLTPDSQLHAPSPVTTTEGQPPVSRRLSPEFGVLNGTASGGPVGTTAAPSPAVTVVDASTQDMDAAIQAALDAEPNAAAALATPSVEAVVPPELLTPVGASHSSPTPSPTVTTGVVLATPTATAAVPVEASGRDSSRARSPGAAVVAPASLSALGVQVSLLLRVYRRLSTPALYVACACCTRYTLTGPCWCACEWCLLCAL